MTNAATSTPRARIVGAGRGAAWLAAGWRNFRRAPLAWVAAVMTYWLAMTGLSFVPVVGVALGSILVPGLSVGLMELARDCEEGRRVSIGTLFLAIRRNPRPQLVLGVTYFLLLLAALACSALADGGLFARLMLTGEAPGREDIVSGAILPGVATGMLLYAPVMLAFWFAPVLAAWEGVSPGKALFFSFVASLINWKPFTLYGFLVAVAAFAIPFLALAALAPLTRLGAGLAPLSLLVPIVIACMPALFASFYASYVDIFAAEQEPAAAG